MLMSSILLPISKHNPADASVASHQLMERVGMISKLSSGLYNWLPLGMRVLHKVTSIIREELDKAGCQEVLNPLIQPADLWRASGRYEDYGQEMLRMQDRHGNDMLFSPTNEEAMTDLLKRFVFSYRQLPQVIYQIQWKFRDEIRPRFGLMRAREFLMKDAYSFDVSPEAARETYRLIFDTYLRLFRRLGLTALPLKADPGPIGGDLCHEFHVVADTGESGLYYDPKLLDLVEKGELSLDNLNDYYAATDDVHDEANGGPNLVTKRGIEVGHIFYFGTKYSTPLGAMFDDATGSKRPMEMGSYGIGVSRVIAATIEANHSENAIYWPTAIAPFTVSLINLKAEDENCNAQAKRLYEGLQRAGIEVLYDNTVASAGQKFANHELIGSPIHVVVSPRNLANNQVEVKHHKRQAEVKLLDISQVVNYCLDSLKA